MTDQIIIIKDEYEIKKLIKKGDKNTLVVCLNPDLEKNIREKYPAKRLKLLNEYSLKEDNAVNWIKNLALKKIEDKKDIKEYFSYDGFSFWWQMEYWLYESYAYHDSWKSSLDSFATFKNMVLNESPKKIIFFNDGSACSKSLQILCKKYGIEIKKIFTIKKLQFNIAKKIKIFLIKGYLEISHILRKVVWSYSKVLTGKNFEDIKNRLFFLCYSSTPWENKNDRYIGPILSRLKKNRKDYFYIEVPFAQFRGIIGLPKKSKEANNIIAIEEFMDKNTIKKAKNIQKEILSRYKKLTKENRLSDFFIYDGINIQSLLMPQFSCYFETRLKWHSLDLAASENLIKKTAPKAVIDPTETSETAKCFFHWCKEHGIPSIAIQHGVINDLRCIHTKEEIDNGFPLPKITAVYSEKDMEFLVKDGNYPKEGLKITGNQRYDAVWNDMKSFDSGKIKSDFGINDSKKNILLISSPFSSKKDVEIFTDEVIKEVSLMEKSRLIIKVHPLEDETLYEQSVKKFKNLDYKIIKNEDMFKLLFICDAAITAFSMAGLETMILRKPLIILNLTGKDYPVDYSKEGAALKVDRKGKLKNEILKILKNKKSREELIKASQEYLNKNLYKIDGNASKRIAWIIEESIKS